MSGSGGDAETYNDGDDGGGGDDVRADRDECPRRVDTAPSRAWFVFGDVACSPVGRDRSGCSALGRSL